MPSCHLDPSGIKHAKEKRSQPYSWEQRKLEDIIRRYDNLRVPVTASKRKHGDIPYYGANGIQDFVSGYTHDGEFILVAEDGARDPKNYPVNYVNGKIWVNNHAHVLQGIQGLANNLFLLNGIKKINIAAYLVGGSRAKLNAETLMQLSIKLPSIHEQEKLGQLFQSLDKTITLHEEKQRQLEQLKKALLQKMFADKTGYPVLRFKGFTEKWEQEKLGNIIRQSSLKNNNFNYPILTSAHEGLVPQSVHFGSQQRHDTSDYNVIKPNQITYRNRSDDGRFTFNINKLNITGLVSKFYPVFSLENTDNDFIVNNLNNNPQIKYGLDMLSVGTGQHVLSFTNLKKYEILAPSYVEQKRIGQLLLQLDKTITLHDKKIQYLKQLKRGLLQKMFV